VTHFSHSLRAPPQGSRLVATAVALAAHGGKAGMAAVLQWWVCVLGRRQPEHDLSQRVANLLRGGAAARAGSRLLRRGVMVGAGLAAAGLLAACVPAGYGTYSPAAGRAATPTEW